MDIIIQTAKPNQLPELKKIWSECFGDSDDYIELFFKHRYRSTTALTAICSGKTVGAVYLMPVSANEYGINKKGWYVYAAGVLKKYRKNGIYATMHSKMYSIMKQNNEFCVLCPANKKLYEYYTTLGYKDYSLLADVSIKSDNTNIEIFKAESISANEYAKMRNSYFKSDGLIRWNEEAVKYAILDNAFDGGYAIKITDFNRSYAMLAKPYGNIVKITESTVPQSRMRSVTNFICKKYSKKSAVWTRAAYDTSEKSTYISALSINLKKTEFPYMNLLLN